MSYQRVIDNTMEKAKSFSDPKITASVNDINEKYKKLQDFAKVGL